MFVVIWLVSCWPKTIHVIRDNNFFRICLPKTMKMELEALELFLGIIHLVRTQNFPKNLFLAP